MYESDEGLEDKLVIGFDEFDQKSSYECRNSCEDTIFCSLSEEEKEEDDEWSTRNGKSLLFVTCGNRFRALVDIAILLDSFSAFVSFFFFS